MSGPESEAMAVTNLSWKEALMSSSTAMSQGFVWLNCSTSSTMNSPSLPVKPFQKVTVTGPSAAAGTAIQLMHMTNARSRVTVFLVAILDPSILLFVQPRLADINPSGRW